MKVFRAFIFTCISAIVFFSHETLLCFPEELSLGIADMKFNSALEPKFRILEFGDGARSRFDGYDLLFGRGAMWRLFWHYLVKQGLPVWCIDASDDQDLRADMAQDVLKKLGGRCVRSAQELIKKLKSKRVNFSSYRAFVFVKFRKKVKPPKLYALYKKLPGLVFIGAATARHMKTKLKTNALFQDCVLRKFRPKNIVCFKDYTEDMANTIINHLKCEMFVIKPVNDTEARGVIPVHKDDLDDILKLICKKISIDESLAHEDAYAYWMTNKNNKFFVEEYIPSQVMYAAGKRYDPTMRIVFVLHHKNGNNKITILGGFWKLPARSLDEKGTLIEHHVSNVYEGDVTRALKISSQDMKIIKDTFPPILNRVYMKMLRARR